MACGGGGDGEESPNDSTTTENESIDNNNFAVLETETVVELEKFFSPTLVERIDQFAKSFENSKTDEEFEANYHEGEEIFKLMDQAFESPETEYLKDLKLNALDWNPVSYCLEDLHVLDGKVGPIVFSCNREQTLLEFVFDLDMLKEKALETEGFADDDFIDLVIAVEGKSYGIAGSHGFNAWFIQTYENGGTSKLGEGILFDCVQKAKDFKKMHSQFGPEMELLHQEFLSEMVYGKWYMHSQEKVLQEFEDILGLDYFTDDELKQIKKFKKELEKGKDIEFGCEDGHCLYEV